MRIVCKTQLWLALCAVMITGACDTETDTGEQPATQPGFSVDSPAPAPMPEPAPADTQANASVPAPPDDATDKPARPEPARGVIPATYQGRWDRSAEACGMSTSEMRLNVSSTSLRFYEGSSRVLAVRNVAGGIEVDVEHTAEGETDRRTYRLTRSGNQLTVTVDGHAATRVRCAG